MATRYVEGCHEKGIFTYFLVCGGLSNDDVRVVMGTVFQEIRPGVGFKTGDFVKEKLGGLPYNDSFLYLALRVSLFSLVC